MNRPAPTAGMRHVALYVEDIEACMEFYVGLLGMEVEWTPDADNVYLTSAGQDNLALHRAPQAIARDSGQSLDHIGFIMHTPQQVDDWYEFLLARGVRMKTEPRSHRDGARSFYCSDPAGTTVQMIYHPPIAATIG